MYKCNIVQNIDNFCWQCCWTTWKN